MKKLVAVADINEPDWPVANALRELSETGPKKLVWPPTNFVSCYDYYSMLEPDEDNRKVLLEISLRGEDEFSKTLWPKTIIQPT